MSTHLSIAPMGKLRKYFPGKIFKTFLKMFCLFVNPALSCLAMDLYLDTDIIVVLNSHNIPPSPLQHALTPSLNF